MSRESASEQHLTLVSRAIKGFLIGTIALTFGQVVIATLIPLMELGGVHKDSCILLLKLLVVLFICVPIYRLRDRTLRNTYTLMAVLLIVLQVAYLFGDRTQIVNFFLRAADAVVIALLVVVVYRLATTYASAKEAIEEEFLSELAEGTSNRIGRDFLLGLASSTARTLKTRHVCVTATQGPGPTEKIMAAATRNGSLPSGLASGEMIDFPCSKIQGQSVHAIPLTDSSGKKLGHICLLHDGGLKLTKRQTSTLQVFGARAAAELERKLLDETNSALESKMLQVQKLQSLGVMAGGIAHDFNNLLAAIRSNASVLRGQVDTCKMDENETLAGIESAVERGASLCNQLLAYAGCSVRQNVVCDINGMIRQLNTVVRATHPDRVFELRLAKSPTFVWGDEAQLSQVMLNLMTNAVEAADQAPHGLLVTTSTTTDKTPQNPLIDRECVRIEVTDRGNGIPEDDLERIFDPFYTTKGNSRGLGLAAVLGIVHQHGGEISVCSRPSHGTTFVLTLPLHQTHEFTGELPTEATAHSTLDTEYRVLLVDDEPLVRDATRSLLELSGMNVVTAECGPQAIEAFQREGDVFHAIVLDQTMPGMTGIETYYMLRELGATGRGILMSGYSDQALGECPFELTFLPKPYEASKLFAAISGSQQQQSEHARF